MRDTRYQPLSFSVQVGQQEVRFDLEPMQARRGRGKDEDMNPERLRFQIKTWPGREEARAVWEDDEQGKIEDRLTAIAVELLVSGEIQYREGVRYAHEWRIERKRQIEEQRRREKQEQERREREREAALQKARVDRLLAEADALRCARDIRTYVDEVRAENERSPNPVPKEEIEAWAIWALQQADLVDPVQSRAFLAIGDGESRRHPGKIGRCDL